MNKIKHILAIASGKGGVGKSSTAVNLATALSLTGRKVGLLDCDIYGPSIPRMLGVKDAHPATVGEDKISPVLAHGLKAMSMGFLVNENSPTVWRGPMLQKAVFQMLEDTEWGELDVLVLDLPPGTGDVQLALAQKGNLTGAIIVSTPQDIALIDARKGLEMFSKLNVKIFGLIENMATFCCPNCGTETDIFSQGGVEKAAKELNLPLLAKLPLSPDYRKHTDEGKPAVITLPDSQIAETYRTLATTIWQALEDTKLKPAKVIIE